MSIFKAIFGGLFQAFLAMFGLSDAQKYQKTEDSLKTANNTIQDVRLSNEVHQDVSNMPDADKRKLLSKHWSE